MSTKTEEIAVIDSPVIGSTAMMFGANNLERAMQVADAMASAKVSVPNHLRGNPGDCLAIVMQASQWGMNPFAVAQKTHLVNGTLGYEAQLVNAVIQASGAIVGRFHYEYDGEGDMVSCRVGAVIKGEKDITWGEWLMAKHVTTKNSPLWKTNPKQQLGYLQVKNWARQYAPGAILGIYSEDEFEPAPVRDMGTLDRTTGEVKPKDLPAYTAEQIDANVDTWRAAIASGKTTAERLVNTIQSKYTLTAEQIKKIEDLGTEPAGNVIDADFVADMEGAEQ